MNPKNCIYKLFYFIVQFQINNNLFRHKDKFKRDDIVTWNWKAKIQINTCVKNCPGFFKIINITKYRDSDGLIFEDKKYGGTTGGDAFWYRKMNVFDKIFSSPNIN